MIKNYLIISLRSLLKHRFYAAINITGLALGLAASLLLTTWIIHELSYDTFHVNAKRIYRSSMEYSFGGQTARTSVSPTALLPALQKNFQEIESGVRLYNPSSWNPFILRKDDKLFQEERFFYADSTFFEVFSFDLLSGNPDKALTEPNTVVLTQTSAKKYFGSEDPLGKTIQVNNKTEYLVTGVMEDVPSHSYLQFDFIGSFSSLGASREQIWWSANYETYVLLAPGSDIASLTSKTEILVKKELASELTDPGDYVRYNFIPLTDIYLRSDMNESVQVSDIKYIYIFGSIAFLLMMIACINYINLATARAADRAKEVGIRKVVGALKKQLFLQFIGESLVITFFSLVTALVIVKLSLPAFDALTGKVFAGKMIFSPVYIGAAVVLSLGVAMLAGAYPSLAITSFKPVQVLKGNFKTSGKGIWLRRSLVVFQFSISVALIVGTLVVIKQLDFIQNKKLGYNKENIIILPLDSKTEEVYSQLRTEVLKSGTASSMSRATESPTQIAGGYSITLDGGNDNGMIVTAMSVDTAFINGLGMELSEGRNFTQADFDKTKSDTIYSFILNESALHELALDKEKVIGISANLNGRKGQIVGVVKDFHYAPLQKKIAPLVLFNQERDFSYIFVKLRAGKESLAEMERICRQLLPHRPFEYTFLDQQYNAMYDNEQRMGKIVTVFAFLTIVIACLGLLGLVSFSAAQKTKEIGIRKVLGANATSIIFLITSDFTKLVVVSIVIGVPVSCWMLQQWLNDFAYKTEIGLLPVFISSGLCITIALVTAGYHAIKAALINPANTLRNE